jgi:phospholipase/carboxylesterase
MPTPLSGPVASPPSGAKPTALVVLLHGVGADGHDLISLASHWAPLLPNAEFVAPDGPQPCDMAPYGRQWFSLQDRTPSVIFAGVSASAPSLDRFLDEALAARGLDDSRLALVGFSQGTMMSLHVGLRRARPLAGIVGFSGALTGPDHLAAEIRSRPPVLLIHGEADPVVPFSMLGLAEQTLNANQVPVETLACPRLGHSIDEAGLKRGGAFLQRVLGTIKQD